mmetsp:Transcript_34661/g.54127  ORF Transcript_34661/g.54127 Transcript_34661/m.54127 type:complete len:250 (-) Transcript_34661:537-1286(-)
MKKCIDSNGPVKFSFTDEEQQTRNLLSEQKVNAIKKIGIGFENKILLQFKEVFWPTDDQHAYMNCTDNRFRFVNLHKHGKTGIIVAHASPPWSRGFKDDAEGSISGVPNARLDDKKVVKVVVEVLAKMFPEHGKHKDARTSQLIEMLVDHRVTRWDEDQYSLGSYSFFATGSDFDDSGFLSRPEPNKISGPVFFAGEACAPPNCAQCVHGAFRTGRKAADDVLRAFHHFKKASGHSATACSAMSKDSKM